jgi:hypothetical protein
MVGLFMNYDQCVTKDMDDQIIFHIKKFENLQSRDKKEFQNFYSVFF